MQFRIASAEPDAASEYVMTVGSDGVESFTLEAGNMPLDQTTKGEAIIKLDWSSIADTSHFTGDVAASVASYLLTPTRRRARFHAVAIPSHGPQPRSVVDGGAVV